MTYETQVTRNLFQVGVASIREVYGVTFCLQNKSKKLNKKRATDENKKNK